MFHQQNRQYMMTCETVEYFSSFHFECSFETFFYILKFGTLFY